MIIDGKAIAKKLEEEIIKKLQGKKKTLHFILFGKNRASEQFVAFKSKIAERLGIKTITKIFSNNLTTDKAVKIIEEISKISDGIVVQLPLPKNIAAEKVLNAIPSDLDIDLLNTETKKMFADDKIKKVPPVARAVSEILKIYNVRLTNKNIVLLGYGPLVGKPVSMWLTREHIPHTIIQKENSAETRYKILLSADIIISGIGKPHFLKPNMIKDGVVLIDAGTSESNGKFVGDISPSCADRASFITPVPGGVGPVTVASLFLNLF